MKIRDLERARRDFDARYAIDYPLPTQAETSNIKQGGALIWIWGVVALAGAVISLPHTLRAVLSTVEGLPMWASIAYSVAVFVGVELALITVAYTQAYNTLKNPTAKVPMTLRTILQAIAFRIGLVDTPTKTHTTTVMPHTTHTEGNIGGLLAVLFASALLFNMADATQNEVLLSLTKYIAGALAPMLLLLAGHNFAYLLATKMLASQIAQRAHDEAVKRWYAQRDEAWRDFVATITTPPTPNKPEDEPHLVNGGGFLAVNGGNYLRQNGAEGL